MLAPLFHLLRKVSALSLASPMASTSSRLVSPPFALVVLRQRSSSLASTSVIVLMFTCPRVRHIRGSFVVYPFSVMRGVADRCAGRQLSTFGW